MRKAQQLAPVPAPQDVVLPEGEWTAARLLPDPEGKAFHILVGQQVVAFCEGQNVADIIINAVNRNVNFVELLKQHIYNTETPFNAPMSLCSGCFLLEVEGKDNQDVYIAHIQRLLQKRGNHGRK